MLISHRSKALSVLARATTRLVVLLFCCIGLIAVGCSSSGSTEKSPTDGGTQTDRDQNTDSGAQDNTAPKDESSTPEQSTAKDEGSNDSNAPDPGQPDTNTAPESQPEQSGSKISFSKEIQPIFQAYNCNNGYCHGSKAGGLILGTEAYKNLVNVKSGQVSTWVRVKPGDPAKSYLYEKLAKSKPVTGSQMPKGGNPLKADELQKIADWIKDGAPNN